MRTCWSGAAYRFWRRRMAIRRLALAEQHDGVIHLVLTDVVMPGRSGRRSLRSSSASPVAAGSLYFGLYQRRGVTSRRQGRRSRFSPSPLPRMNSPGKSRRSSMPSRDHVAVSRRHRERPVLRQASVLWPWSGGSAWPQPEQPNNGHQLATCSEQCGRRPREPWSGFWGRPDRNCSKIAARAKRKPATFSRAFVCWPNSATFSVGPGGSNLRPAVYETAALPLAMGRVCINNTTSPTWVFVSSCSLNPQPLTAATLPPDGPGSGAQGSGGSRGGMPVQRYHMGRITKPLRMKGAMSSRLVVGAMSRPVKKTTIKSPPRRSRCSQRSGQPASDQDDHRKDDHRRCEDA